MKKLLLFVLCSFGFVEIISAQTVKMYISRHGGKLNPQTGEFSYNYTCYNYNGICDTLKCIGPGYLTCEIPDGAYKWNQATSIAYPRFRE